MSSHTQIEIRLRTQVQSNQRLRVEEILGPQGVLLVQNTLSALTQRSPSEALGWSRLAEQAQETYETKIPSECLPPSIREFVDAPGLAIQMAFRTRCGGRIRSVSFNYLAGTTRRSLDEGSFEDVQVQEGLRKTTHGKVNELLCVAMLAPLEREMKQLYEGNPEYQIQTSGIHPEYIPPRGPTQSMDHQLEHDPRIAVPSRRPGLERRATQGFQTTVLFRKAVMS